MKRLILGNIICGTFLGCTPEQSTVSEYQIVSGLGVPLVLRFFRNGLPSEQKTISKTGVGEIFRDGDTQTGVLIYEIFVQTPL